jgi:hypothetical protein
MSTELDRALDALRARADTALLPPAADLRARGDHRRRIFVISATVAVAVLVVGIGVGASVLRTLAVPTPAVTPHPTVTAAPNPSPTVEPPQLYPTGSPIPMPAGCDEVHSYPYQGPTRRGDVLPESIMLTAQDWGRCYALINDLGGYEVYDPEHFGAPAPDVCQNGEAYAQDAYRTAGRFRGFTAGPVTGGTESVTRYEPSHAQAFMAEIRARVAQCATFIPLENQDGEWHSKIIDSGFAGNESLLIYVGTSPTAAPDSYPGWYIGVVRVGDLVAIVEPHFDLGGNRDWTRTMTKLAAGLL